MTSFTHADGSLSPYPRKHPQLVLNPGFATQDERVTPLSSGRGSLNYFDTPEDSMSLNMSFGRGEEELSLHGHSDDSINHWHAAQRFPSPLQTINPACLDRRRRDSEGQDGFFTPSSSSPSAIRSTQEISLPREDGRTNHQDMGPQLVEGTAEEDVSRGFAFKGRGNVAFDNDGEEIFFADQFEAIIPETLTPSTSSKLFLRPDTFIHNHDLNPPEQTSTPFNSGYQSQNTLQEVSNSFSNEPWTSWRATYPPEYEPGPDEVMLAPNDSLGTEGLHIARPLGREADNNEHVEEPPLYRFSHENEDRIDEPPAGVPVGPPIEKLDNSPFGPERPPFTKSLGRRGKLDEITAQAAKIMRDKKACWPCRLLRYKCDPSAPCRPCRHARSQPTFYPGCIRDCLPEFAEIFIPPNLMAQHEAENLVRFVKRHIQAWTRNTMTVSITWGYGLPIKVDVKEFKPKGDFLLLQSQYRWSMATNKYETVRVPSPPIGIVLIDSKDWQKKLDAHFDWEVEENFAGFPEQCFRGQQFEVQKDILNSLHSHHVALKQRVRRELGPEFQRARASILVKSYETIRICLKLLIVTHIMTRTLTLVESTKNQVYSKLQRRPTEAFGVHTSSRILNKELKYIIAPLYRDLWTKFLDQVHNTLLVGHKDKFPSWATILGCLLTLAMTMESVQVNVRCKEATDKYDKVIPEDSTDATLDLARMEEKWEILVSLFHKAFPRFKPVQKEEDRKKLDIPSQGLAQRIKNIIEFHRGFLESRRLLGPPMTSQDPNNSRLVAKLLLSLKIDTDRSDAS